MTEEVSDVGLCIIFLIHLLLKLLVGLFVLPLSLELISYPSFSTSFTIDHSVLETYIPFCLSIDYQLCSCIVLHSGWIAKEKSRVSVLARRMCWICIIKPLSASIVITLLIWKLRRSFAWPATVINSTCIYLFFIYVMSKSFRFLSHSKV